MAGAFTCTAGASTCTGNVITDEYFDYSARGELTETYQSTPHSGGYYHPTAAYCANGALNNLWMSSLPSISFAADGEGRTWSVSGGWPSLSRFLRRLGMFTRHCKATKLVIISLHALGIEALSATSRTAFHYVLLLSSPCSAGNRKGSRRVCHCPRKSANLVWTLYCRLCGHARACPSPH
jgi:hypothetical protein